MATSDADTCTNLLHSVTWTCTSIGTGTAASPAELESATWRWIPATVPGTAASAFRAAGVPLDFGEIDNQEWWWQGEFFQPFAQSSFRLRCDGIATLWTVFIDGVEIINGSNMFLGADVLVDLANGPHRIHLRCQALGPVLNTRHPRPRWRSAVVAHQNYRWLHTTMLGRTPSWTVTPPPVGPWRAISIAPVPALETTSHLVRAICDETGPGGHLSVDVTLAGAFDLDTVRVELRRGAEIVATAAVESVTTGEPKPGPGSSDGAQANTMLHSSAVLWFDVAVEEVERWWPHTHGQQPLYDVELLVDTNRFALGQVGFRTIEVDTTNGAFRLVVNGESIFVRGAAWFPIDPTSFNATSDDARATLQLARRAGLNMVRIPGGTTYEHDSFFTACDELGLLVWQDSMLAFVDPPDDAEFGAELERELEAVLAPLGQHPALAMFCGGQEIEAHAAMFGLSAPERTSSVLSVLIPGVASRLIADVPYVTSSPIGGEPPFRIDTGISHYYGVGTYLRDLSDAQSAGVRFMSEGMAFATPPENETMLKAFGKMTVVGHDPEWKQSIHHEAGRAFDLEDVREFYVRELFGVDVLLSRYLDAEHHLDLGRAVVAEIFTTVLSKWRSADSSCDGALLIALRDLTPGAGWGVIDALGRPKAPWYALQRIFAPTAAYICDYGLDGYALHVVNDQEADISTSLDVALFGHSSIPLERVTLERELLPHSQLRIDFAEIFDGFRDLSYAFRFGQLEVEAVQVIMNAGDAAPAHFVVLPGGPRRERGREIGLFATASAVEETWELTIGTREVAQYVAIDISGFIPDDSWFHLAPGTSRTVRLRGDGRRPIPTGVVRALNAREQVAIEILG